MKISNIEFKEAVWTPDVAGKQDFDFPVLSVSTRYWRDHTARPSIWIGNEPFIELPKGVYIQGESEEECKLKVEEWLKENLSKIISKIKS